MPLPPKLNLSFVMAGLRPGHPRLTRWVKDVDARDKRGHDGGGAKPKISQSDSMPAPRTRSAPSPIGRGRSEGFRSIEKSRTPSPQPFPTGERGHTEYASRSNI